MSGQAATIAALFVDPAGVYANLPDVEVWDEARDARLYMGPWPVVAHPPCARWCSLAGLVEATHGHKKGDDGGSFAAALHAVRTYGGVLEHPANSRAWNHYRLPIPRSTVGWTRSLLDDGASCYVEQSGYGHVARKPTWLYAAGVPFPDLAWVNGRTRWRAGDPEWGTRWIAYKERGCGIRLRGKLASATPIAFRDVLIAMARSAAPFAEPGSAPGPSGRAATPENTATQGTA